MESGSEKPGKVRIRRRVFLIDSKFQLKWTLIIVLVGVMVSALLGYFIISKSIENTELMNLELDLKAQVSQYDTNTLIMLLAFVLVMALFLFIWGVLMTHKVSGPIFIISRYLRQLAEGQGPQVRPLRKGDELKHFFDTFSSMLQAFKDRHQQEAEQLSEVARVLREKGADDLNTAAQTLEELVEQKRAWGADQGEPTQPGSK